MMGHALALGLLLIVMSAQVANGIIDMWDPKQDRTWRQYWRLGADVVISAWAGGSLFWVLVP